jgi:L-histidine Nalpha-methyltransferase
MVRTPRFIQLQPVDDARQMPALWSGLQAPVARVSPKYFYDALGSRLFEAITELDEYYPTRTEAAIFDAHSADMAARLRAHVGAAHDLIDLGAGSCAKAAKLFPLFAPLRRGRHFGRLPEALARVPAARPSGHGHAGCRPRLFGRPRTAGDAV